MNDIELLTKQEAKKIGFEVICFQSNHEGALIDFIQENTSDAFAIIINPGALTRYGYALYDALIDTGLPCVEVHLSDINNREDWRKHSVVTKACIGQISGKKEIGYIEAIKKIYDYTKNNT